MINKIVIENFRCFKRFQLSSLKQLNIIVGDNNSGKTALLEAVSIACKPHLKHLFWLVQQRIENPDSITSIQEELDFLFNSSSGEEKIAKIGVDDSFQFIIQNNYNIKSEENGITRKYFAIHYENQKNVCNSEIIQIEHLETKDFTKVNSQIGTLAYESSENQFTIIVSKIGGVIFISSSCNFQQSFNSTFAYLLRYKKDIWKKYLKNFLQKIYPDLNDIIFIDSRIMVETQEKTLPLSYLGDAFKKAFYLLLAIYCCEGGVLLIDEFENGIHYENQQIIWDMLLSASKEFNVQLFISTHSYEMLEYLQKAIENQSQEDKTHWQEQLSLYSLLKINGEPSCFLYSYAGFESFIENNREFR